MAFQALRPFTIFHRSRPDLIMSLSSRGGATMRGDGMTMRLVDALYLEAMVLADESRDYFDGAGRIERETLAPLARVAFTCESLKVTTRLMHVIAWLLTRRALAAGEITPGEARDPTRALGTVRGGDAAEMAALPDTARALIAASDDLYRRVRRLRDGLDDLRPVRPSPARRLIARLENAF